MGERKPWSRWGCNSLTSSTSLEHLLALDPNKYAARVLAQRNMCKASHLQQKELESSLCLAKGTATRGVKLKKKKYRTV